MPERRFDHLHMKEMIFVLTDNCNLNCVYCYENNKNRSDKTLSAEFIKSRIRGQMLADDGSGELWIDFFGGEPLLEFNTIAAVVEWFVATAWPQPSKAFRFLVETNGTLLDDRMKQWFSAHRDYVTLGLSLDGTKDAHDRNRSNSYDQVAKHIDFFRKNWPQQPVKMTIGPDTIDQVYEGVLHIYSLGLQVDFDVVFEDVWGDAEAERRAVRTWAEQLDKLVPFYFAHPELRRPMVLTRNLEHLFTRTTTEKRTFCGAGKYVTSFTPDGIEYPCFRFAPIAVGEPLLDVFSAPGLENEQCAKCPFEKICTTCEGHNYSVTGSCFKRTAFHCNFFKVSLLACARLLMLDHPGDLSGPPEGESKEEQLNRMRRLLAVRAVNDLCSPVLGPGVLAQVHNLPR
ncbi:MAG: radical SAM protein [Syntrophaceae bacterium]